MASRWFARRVIGEWRTDDNTERPQTSLGGLTPNEFAARSRAERILVVNGDRPGARSDRLDKVDGPTPTGMSGACHQTGLERYSGRRCAEFGSEWVSWSHGLMVGATSL